MFKHQEKISFCFFHMKMFISYKNEFIFIIEIFYCNFKLSKKSFRYAVNFDIYKILLARFLCTVVLHCANKQLSSWGCVPFGFYTGTVTPSSDVRGLIFLQKFFSENAINII